MRTAGAWPRAGASRKGESATRSAVEGTRAAGSGAGAEVRWATTASAGPGTSRAGTDGETQLYRPGFADHEGRSDEGICANLQRAGGSGQPRASHRGGGRNARGE